MKVLKFMQGQKPMVQMIGLLCRSIVNFIICYIYNHHQCVVSNVNPLSPNFMKYCLNAIHHMFKTGARRLKLSTVSAILATTWYLVVYLSESVNIFFLQPLLKVQVLMECWLCDLSGILDKVYLSLLTKFSSKSQQLMVCTNLLGYCNWYVQFTELPTAIFLTKRDIYD